VAIGTRLTDFTTASMTAFRRPGVRFVGVNVSAFDAHKQGALAVVGDARATLGALLEAVDAVTSQAYRSDITRLRDDWDATVRLLLAPRRSPGAVGISQAQVIGVVNAACDRNSTVINAAGSMPGDLIKLWRAEDAKAYHVEYGFSCMGYEIPAGIGVKLADPQRHVVVVIGDGSYLMLNSEIVTAVAEGIDLTIVLVDNHGFQSINALQTSVGIPSFANELRFRDPSSGQLDGDHVPIDFAAHARSLGAGAVTVHDEPALSAALADAKSRGGVNVVVVPTSVSNRVPGFDSWWDVPVAAASASSGVSRARDEYEQHLAAVREHRFGPGVDHDEGSEERE